jgi:hypothetical protein
MRDRNERERAPHHSSLPDPIAGLPELCGLVVLLIALVAGCGNKAKERDYCTERAASKLMAEVKQKYPQDKWEVTCDPKTGVVTHTQKPLDGGVDDGGKE